jgi:serine/threonine protein kinase
VIAAGASLDGKYQVLRSLGTGGFGEVLLAADEGIPGRQVAIKVLNRAADGDHSDLIWEMRALAKFEHAGVVALHHHFTDDQRLFLVMEFCAGGSLRDRLRGSVKRSEAEVSTWGLTLCETLAFVHGKGIVHHDVKPENILFKDDRTVKLGDFGVANRNVGTRIYLPPEMLLGETVSNTDPRVDVYALGLTMLEALTGHHPFIDLMPGEAIQARIAHCFVPFGPPRWWQEVLLKATHPTPELRFQTMTDFADAIRGRSVPYVFDGKRIKAHLLAESAERKIARRKWITAAREAEHALALCPDCVGAHLALGRCRLMTRQLDRARGYFSRAVAINPRTQVQKELGWLSLEEGNLPAAISFLTDHLQRNGADYEAYNLLLKCFYLSDRYDAGEDLAQAVMAEKPPNDCFRTNLFLCQLLNGEYSEVGLAKENAGKPACPFMAYNLGVARERPRAWAPDGTPTLKSKLVFEEYHLGTAHRGAKPNHLVLHMPDGGQHDLMAPVISVGSLGANEIVLRDGSVSRRHAVIVSLPGEVWVYDLASAVGTFVDGQRVEGRTFVDSVREVRIGHQALRMSPDAGLLL